ncbi:MAG: hypothetical protein IPJ74_08260 [Saprospiraceae bacterium]|nr:hypothetical protein [Saprospiraceae bacterium]
MPSDKPDTLLVVKVTTDVVKIYQWNIHQNKLTLQAEVPIVTSIHKSLLDNPYYRIYKHDNHLFIFLSNGQGLPIVYDLKSNEVVKTRMGSDVQMLNADFSVGLYNLQINILYHNGALFLCHPFLTNTLLRFDKVQQSWHPYKLGNPGDHRLNMFQDERGNLLCIYRNAKGEQRALLQDTLGVQHDYTDALPRGVKLNTLASRDFRQQVLVGTPTGLHAIEVSQDLGIQTFFKDASLRWLFENPQQSSVVAGLRSVGWKNISRQNIISDNEFLNNCDPAIDIPSHTLGDIVKDSAQHYWRVFERRLYRYNLSQNTCKSYLLNTSDQFPPNNPLAYVPEHKIALGHQASGKLYFFDIATETLSTYQENGSTKIFLGHPRQIKQSSEGNLLVATLNGWYEVDYRNQTSTLHHEGTEIISIFEDSQQRIWLGTAENGLYIYHIDKDSTQIVNTTSGLANNTVVSVLEDDDGMFWVGTYTGLSLVSKDGEVITNFYTQHGLSSNEFNRFSALKASDGRLWFGTIKGLNAFDPAFVKQQLFCETAPHIFLTEATWFDDTVGKEVVQQTDLYALQGITLSPWHRYLSLRFAVSSYVKPQENEYAYKIEGIHNDWEALGEHPFLDLNNLPIGTYDSLIRGANYKNRWTENTIRLTIEVRPFFFQTLWFRLSIALLIIIALYFIIHKRWQKKVSVAVENTFNELPPTKLPLLQQVQQFIERNIQQENLSVQNICDALNISRTKLHNEIKKQTGFSTTRYIRRVRLERAKTLLKPPILPLLKSPTRSATSIQSISRGYSQKNLASHPAMHVSRGSSIEKPGSFSNF